MPNNNLSPLKINPAERLASLKPYFFVSLEQKIAELSSKGMDVIRLDMGSPDLPPSDSIIHSLISAAQRPDKHGYTPHGGTLAFRQAVAAYYLKRYGVKLEPKTEILALLGAKEGIFNLTQALIDPGDVVMIPDPGYPVYKNSTLIAGGEIYLISLLKENGFLPDLNAIPRDAAQSAKLIWLNYPNNPTGAVASFEWLTSAVKFARENNVIIAYDAPYNEVAYNGYIAPSILQIPGAKQVAIEFNSLSKTYNMAGWRLAMAVGNPELVHCLSTLKSQVDSSHFAPILEAGIAALTGNQNWLIKRNMIYQERRDIVLDALHKIGLWTSPPQAAIYVWASIPNSFKTSLEFCNQLLDSTGISVVPGTLYGENGENYIRISLTTPTELINEAMQRLIKWLSSLEQETQKPSC